MKTLRTFIAVPIKVGNLFLLAREEMMEALSGEKITWVDPPSYHVTIRFFGATSLGMKKEIRQSMREGLEMSGNVIVNLGTIGSFGPQKSPRVIWVGFEDSSPFKELYGQVEARLKTCGIKPAEQPFKPHLTLGRIRGLKDIRQYNQVSESLRDRFSGKVGIDRLVFYKSELGSGRPVYTPLEEVLFSDQAF
jgi:2'-5' RNA ligase